MDVPIRGVDRLTEVWLIFVMLVKSRIRVQQEELVARQQPVRLPPIENPPMPPDEASEEAPPEPSAEAESAAEPAAGPGPDPAPEPEPEPEPVSEPLTEPLPEPLPELQSELVLDPEPPRQPTLAREPAQTGCGCFRRPPPPPRLPPATRKPSQSPAVFLTVVAPAGLVPGQKVSSPVPSLNHPWQLPSVRAAHARLACSLLLTTCKTESPENVMSRFRRELPQGKSFRRPRRHLRACRYTVSTAGDFILSLCTSRCKWLWTA